MRSQKPPDDTSPMYGLDLTIDHCALLEELQTSRGSRSPFEVEQTDEEKGRALSNKAWVRSSSKGPPLPGRHVSSRAIYSALLAAGGIKSVVALALGLAPQTLRRRLAQDDQLRTLWESVAPKYQKLKPVVYAGPRGPRFLRLCTRDEIRDFVARLNEAGHKPGI
jgi:hypothetical protein